MPQSESATEEHGLVQIETKAISGGYSRMICVNLCPSVAELFRLSADAIALAQHVHVMSQVADHNVSQRAHRDRTAVRRSHAQPSSFVERSHHRNVGKTNQPELAQEIFQIDPVERSGQHVLILIEAGQILRIATRNTQSAIAKRALAVD